jgi:hypothetical protein
VIVAHFPIDNELYYPVLSKRCLDANL